MVPGGHGCFDGALQVSCSLFVGDDNALTLLGAKSWYPSPLPANIYFPAIPVLSDSFGKSTELLNQTVTVYLVFQGIC
jgi:hypothetical protein